MTNFRKTNSFTFFRKNIDNNFVSIFTNIVLRSFTSQRIFEKEFGNNKNLFKKQKQLRLSKEDREMEELIADPNVVTDFEHIGCLDVTDFDHKGEIPYEIDSQNGDLNKETSENDDDSNKEISENDDSNKEASEKEDSFSNEKISAKESSAFDQDIQVDYVFSKVKPILVYFNIWDIKQDLVCEKLINNLVIGNTYTMFIRVRHSVDAFFMAGNKIGFKYRNTSDLSEIYQIIDERLDEYLDNYTLTKKDVVYRELSFRKKDKILL